ncbi:competence type IV pilus assembly protein ComGB [Tuberibacillus sp. Marseille-P3662]|uniref:competence type IV pilus assembly protein ComGB n=1 Tax=Tuberibacillus sp. Marseille-P3662 TaxID=1965358 RepID=UPI000A1CD987|nr:competence type IV pilus assembly protein ComGB [Tuberibacillus sp. Marseille-P3662]
MQSSNWSTKKLAEFLKHTGELLRKGYSLTLALELEKQRTHRGHYNACINEMIQALRDGESFHSALQVTGLPSYIRTWIGLAEESSQLEAGLLNIGEMLLLLEQNKTKMGRLLCYPLVLFLTLIIIVYIFTVFLLPNFQHLLTSMAVDPPFLTVFLIESGVFLNDHFILIMLSAVSTLILLLGIQRSIPSYKKINILLKIPFMSRLTQQYLTYLFSLHLGEMLRGGVSFIEAVELLDDDDRGSFLMNEIKVMREQMMAGQPLSEIIKGRPAYLDDLTIIILKGEQYQQLGQALQDYSRIVFRRFEVTIETLIKSIQPAFFVFFGACILLIFYSLMSPMFQVIGSL